MIIVHIHPRPKTAPIVIIHYPTRATFSYAAMPTITLRAAASLYLISKMSRDRYDLEIFIFPPQDGPY